MYWIVIFSLTVGGTGKDGSLTVEDLDIYTRARK